jgi:hypothetical protein
MSVSVVDLYQKVLPKTNCGECGFPTCLAFASMVISEKYPLAKCPHLPTDVMDEYRVKLEEQYASGKWLKRNPAKDALQWAKQRSAKVDFSHLPQRIGGRMIEKNDANFLKLPYFEDFILISPDTVLKADETELTQWEQVFIYNHIAMGGDKTPSGQWKGFEEFPNTVSKMISMKEHVEKPLAEYFQGKIDLLLERAGHLGGKNQTDNIGSADMAISFLPLPRIPVLLMFWDQDTNDGFDARAKLLFDETVTGHLDIESILFLSERFQQLLCQTDSRH